MKTHPSLANITKAYAHINQDAWANTQMVQHESSVIAFAQTVQGTFYYSVLNFNDPEKAGKFRDVDFWNDQPQALQFPTEIVTAGQESVSMYEMPIYKENGSIAASTEFVPIEQRHSYHSTTLCLSQPGAPFKVISDGRYIYIFRQSKEVEPQQIFARAIHTNTSHSTQSGAFTLEPTILVDRFVFDGTKLKHKLEQRYQRSRSKSLPLNLKDTLAYTDLNKHFFYEPTQSLASLIGQTTEGKFTVLLMPTMLPDKQNWQFFVWMPNKSKLKCVNFLRSDDGLFDERGPVFYVSKNRENFPEIFNISPGYDPDGVPLKVWIPDGEDIPEDIVGGKQQFELELSKSICYGMDAVVYAQQGLSQAASGYGTVPKPVMRQQRVLLAITVGGDDGALDNLKGQTITLDFGISQDGRLANSGSLFGLTELKDEHQTSNQAILDQLKPLQAKREYLQIGPDIEYLKAQKTVVKNEFNALFNGVGVQLYQEKDYSKSTLWIGYSAPNIETFTEANLSQYKTVGEDSDGDDRSNDTSSYQVYGNLHITLSNTHSSKTNSSYRSVSNLNSEDLNDDFPYVYLEPNDTLKQEMLMLQKRYKSVMAELKQKEQEFAQIPEDIKSLTPAQMVSKIEDIDRRISQFVRQGHWDVRLPMPHLLATDEARNLTVDGGILDFAWSTHPPELVKNADGRVSMFFRGDRDQAFVLHYDVFNQYKNTIIKVPESVKSLPLQQADKTTVRILLKAPHTIDTTDDVFVFCGANPDETNDTDNCVLSINYETETLNYYQNWNTIKIPFSHESSGDGEVYEGKFIKGDINEIVIVVKGKSSGYPNISDVYLNGSSAYFEFDGSLQEQIVPVNPSEFHLYQRTPEDTIFSGEIIDVTIWEKALSADTVEKMFNGTLPHVSDDGFHLRGDVPMQWVGNKPGLAVKVAITPDDGQEQSALIKTDDNNSRFYVDDDEMTIELWVNPLINNKEGYLLSHPDYFVQLKADKASDPISVNCSFHNKKGTLRQTLRPSAWSHLALVYKAAYGLKFEGSGYVNCGNSQALDMLRDMTIELSLLLADTEKEQCILYKGAVEDEQEQVAYELYIKEGKIRFRCSENHGNGAIKELDVDTNIQLTKDTPTKIAITREYYTDTDGLIDAIGADGDHDIDSSQFSYYIYTFYQDGASRQEHTARKGEPTGSGGDFIVGRRDKDEAFFFGTISEIRVWNVNRDAEKIHSQIKSDTSGLIAWWQINENDGFVIEDAKSNNTGHVVGTQWVKDPNPNAATLRAYINGIQTSLDDASSIPTNTVSTFIIGDNPSGNAYYHGELEEIRLWSVARTEEQIQDNLFRRLDSEYDKLLAYYDCDVEGTKLRDRSGRNLHLLIQPNQFEYSSAPIGVDLPIVRSALAKIKTPFDSSTTSVPTAVEYGDLQRDNSGKEIGVLKRVYSIIHQGHWELVTGYKVGDLVTEWLGQAQFAPQIIGFVEGAPPVPSENLTNDDDDNYTDAVSVELTDAKSTMYTISSSREKTAHLTADFTLMGGASMEASAGIGAEAQVADVEAVHGIHTTLELNSSWVNEAEVGFGKNLTKSSSMVMTGVWENEADIHHQKIGQRFLPRNYGYALVQSETVDIFALRLKKSGIMLGKIVRKNPDIPVDWNIIMFPINKGYTKQGTLDGKIGNENDVDYANANEYSTDSSYYKPLEAYQLKQAIERQEQIARDMYQRFDSHQFGIFNRPDLPDVSKRDIVNTYVWTADGGFFAETTETVDTIQEVSAGSFSMLGSVGYAAEWDISGGGAKVAGNLEVMVGGGITTTVSKSVGVEEGFGLEVNVEIDRDIYKRDDDDKVVYTQGNPTKIPGKVDAYRFMTFYLSPDNRHLHELSNKVIDPEWLQSNDANAKAMRQALAADKSVPWRILHRVTFISRVLPSAASIGGTKSITEQHQLSNRTITSNYDIIQEIEHIINPDDRTSYDNFVSKIREHVQDSKSVLYRYKDHEDDIIALMCLYFGILPTVSQY